MKPRKRNNCFAYQVKDGRGRCRVLLDTYAQEYMEVGDCGNDGCPFYKPKGYEHQYIRGFTTRWLK